MPWDSILNRDLPKRAKKTKKEGLKMIKREFSIKGVGFVVADYRARKNGFEKGLKYQLLIKIYDNPDNSDDYYFMSTGFILTENEF